MSSRRTSDSPESLVPIVISGPSEDNEGEIENWNKQTHQLEWAVGDCGSVDFLILTEKKKKKSSLSP